MEDEPQSKISVFHTVSEVLLYVCNDETNVRLRLPGGRPAHSVDIELSVNVCSISIVSLECSPLEGDGDQHHALQDAIAVHHLVCT